MSDTQLFILIGMGMIMLWITSFTVIDAFVKVRKYHWDRVHDGAREARQERDALAERLYRDRLTDPEAPYDQKHDQEPGRV